MTSLPKEVPRTFHTKSPNGDTGRVTPSVRAVPEIDPRHGRRLRRMGDTGFSGRFTPKVSTDSGGYRTGDTTTAPSPLSLSSSPHPWINTTNSKSKGRFSKESCETVWHPTQPEDLSSAETKSAETKGRRTSSVRNSTVESLFAHRPVPPVVRSKGDPKGRVQHDPVVVLPVNFSCSSRLRPVTR